VAVEKAGLTLTVEQYNQFMQQVGAAGGAMEGLGQQAQEAAQQISTQFPQASQAVSNFARGVLETGKVTNASLAGIVDQLKYNVSDQAIEALTGLTSRAQDILQTVTGWKIPAPELDVAGWNKVAESMADIYPMAGGGKAFATDFKAAADSVVEDQKKIEAGNKELADSNKKATDSFIAFGAALTYVSAKATELVIQTTLVAGRIKELELLLEVTRQNAIALAEGEGDLTKAASLNASAVEAQVQGIRDLHLSGIVANETVAQMIRYNLDWTKATELAAEAQDAATFAAQDSSQALEGLIKGIATLQPRILRTYGIMVNLNEAYRVFANENNIVGRELTQVERQQAALNAVLAQATSISGAYEASLGSATKQVRSVRTDLVNLAEAYGEFLEPAVAGTVSKFRDFLQTLTDFPAPTRAFFSGLTTSGTALLTLTTGAATLLPILQKMKGGFSDLAKAVGISGVAMAGLAVGIPLVIGVVSALIEAEKAHIAEAAQVAASTDTYPAYIRALEIADEKSRILTKQLWEQVRAQEAANQAAYAARILEEQRDMYTRLQQAIDRFGGSLDKAFGAWKDGAESLNEFQLAIMADEEALYNMAIRLGETEGDARSWARAVSDWATVTVEAREEQERLAATDLPEYIEDATLKMTRLTTATDEYSRALQRIINMPLPRQWDEWIDPEDITNFLDDVNDAMDTSARSMEDASTRRNRALEDLDTEYFNKSTDAWIDYQRELQDAEGNLAAFHAGTLDDLLDLDRDYLQDRNDAWTKYQQDLADAERDLQRDIEDASRDRAQRLSDLDAELAQDRTDALRDLNEDLEDAALEHTEKLAEIEQDRQESLLDLQEEYGRRRQEIEKIVLDGMAKLEEDYQEKASDTRLKYARLAYEQSARDRPAHPSREYFIQLFKELELGSKIVPMEYKKLYAQMLKELEELDQDLFWEQQDLTDDLEGEQESRIEDLEAWLAEEQAAIEAAYAEKTAKENERFAEEQESRREDYARKLEDLQRAHEREQAEVELTISASWQILGFRQGAREKNLPGLMRNGLRIWRLSTTAKRYSSGRS